jgi:environmental stress-induced protein Ves
MSFELLHKNDYKTITWSGGTSTQLYIFPKTSSYEKRDFTFRISTATVEQEESTFTVLPATERALMILEGEMEINHQGKYATRLKKHQVHYFQGEWISIGKGQARDFNLMTKNNAKGELEALIMNKDHQMSLTPNCDALGIFLQKGKLNIQQDLGANYSMHSGDFMMLLSESNTCIKLTCEGASEIILAKIKF